MAALDTVPFETLTQILTLLTSSDLAQTSLVCRRLSAVSEPLLYRSPNLDTDHTSRQRLSLHRFIRTLIESPHRTLGAHVRTVSVGWDRSCRLDPAAYPLYPSFHRQAGFHGLHCVLLLHLLPAVRELDISPARDLPDVSRGYLSHCLEAPHGSPGIPTLQLQSLRKFSCLHADYTGGTPHRTRRGGITFLAVLALMKLPCIESIDTHMTDSPGVPPPNSAARFSSITSLRLSVSSPSPLSLAVLLRAPVALRRFSYVVVNLIQFGMRDFTPALAPLQGTLQHLHLALMRADVGFSAEHVCTVGWTALHTLRCSMREMLGVPSDRETPLARVLPRSLRRLEILMDACWVYECVVERVVQLLLVKEEVVPLLESVAMGAWTKCGEDARERLSAACGRAGVRLVKDAELDGGGFDE